MDRLLTFLLVCVPVNYCQIFPTAKGVWDPSFFRIEVVLERYENDGGVTSTGTSCDYFTECDPQISTAFDLFSPLAPYPGSAIGSHYFQLAFGAHNKNSVLSLGTRITRNICDPKILPRNVTLRVQITDYDVFSQDDLIANLDCGFAFVPSPRSAMVWSTVERCREIQNSDRIRLYFKWRIYPIHSGECTTTGLLEPVPETITKLNDGTPAPRKDWVTASPTDGDSPSVELTDFVIVDEITARDESTKPPRTLSPVTESTTTDTTTREYVYYEVPAQ